MMKNPFESDVARLIGLPSSEEVAQRLLKGDAGAMMRKAMRREGMVRTDVDKMEGVSTLLSQAERQKIESMKLRPGELLMPMTDERVSPSEELFTQKGGLYQFDSALDSTENRAFQELGLTPDLLRRLGILDRELFNALMRVPQDASELVIVNVVSIADLIEEQSLPGLVPSTVLSIRDVLMLMHGRGYRPANLKELLAFARQFWQPLEEELLAEDGVYIHTKHLVALGSCLGSIKSLGLIAPALRMAKEERRLSGVAFNNSLSAKDAALFVRDR